MPKKTLEEQLKIHNESIENKITQQKALIIPEYRVLVFAAPLESAGVTMQVHKMTKSKRQDDNKSFLEIGLDGGSGSTNALFKELRSKWVKDNPARQNIVKDYITSNAIVDTLSINCSMFKEPNLVAELASLQAFILESQDKARTYDGDKCAVQLSSIFNVTVRAPRSHIIGGPMKFIGTNKHYTAETIKSETAINKATDRINTVFTKLGLGNHIAADSSIGRRITFEFNVLEHETLMKLLQCNNFNFDPIVQDALNESEQERRNKMGFIERGLDDFVNYLCG